MQKKATPEELEMGIQELLFENPNMTREKLDEMMKAGRPMIEGEEFGDCLQTVQ